MQSSLLLAQNVIYKAIVDHNLALTSQANRGEITHEQYQVQSFPTCALTLIGDAMVESVVLFEKQQKEVAQWQTTGIESSGVELGEPTMKVIK